MKKIYYLFIISILSGACSQYSNSPVNVGFHNLNAKYNAYWQANLLLKEAQKKLFDSRNDNYSQILPILIPTDSISAGSVKTQLDAVIKKASLVAERHQNSKWLDDSYVLIGIARLLKEDFKNAVETFKYVNTISDDDNAKDKGLIQLMRAYIEQEDYQTAGRVAELLREEPLNDENLRDFYITKAYLHQQKKEYKTSVAILEETFPLMKKNEQKARIHFACGQMYEVLGSMERAMYHYDQVRKNRPSYDLGFYANLNNYLLKGTTEGFQKLLSDSKNKDLQDKIYEAMASVEERKNNPDGTSKYLNESIRKNTNTAQLPFIYLKLADLNYEKLQNYEIAAAYYDSTAALIPPKDPQAKKVSERKAFLDDYVKQVTIIKTEDSLQKLAKLDRNALDKAIDKIIRDKQAKEIMEMAKAQEVVNRGQQQLAARNPADPSLQSFYFYNSVAILKGKGEFVQKWSIRPLEDNWRRRNKDSNGFGDGNSLSNPTGVGQPANLQPVADVNEGKLKAMKQEILAKIPFTPETLSASKKKQEDAYFALGKIYKLSLNQPRNAVITFEKLLSDFPKTSYEVEVLYLLYLLSEGNSTGQAFYKEKLLNKFPDSYFTRLVTKGEDSPLSSGKESEAQKLYEEAYEYYSQQNYTDAISFIDTALKEYPNNHLEDKFVFLKILLLGKTQDLQAYQKALDTFLKSYPKSPLIPRAKEMVTALEKTPK